MTREQVRAAILRGILIELDMDYQEAPFGWWDKLNRAADLATDEVMKEQAK